MVFDLTFQIIDDGQFLENIFRNKICLCYREQHVKKMSKQLNFLVPIEHFKIHKQSHFLFIINNKFFYFGFQLIFIHYDPALLYQANCSYFTSTQNNSSHLHNELKDVYIYIKSKHKFYEETFWVISCYFRQFISAEHF